MADQIGAIEVRADMQTDDVEQGVAETNNLIEGLVKKVEDLAAKLRGFFQNLAPKEPVEIETPEIGDPETVETYSAELRDAERTARSLNTDMARIAHTSEMGFRSYDQVLRFSESVQQADQSIASAREQLAELAEAQIPTEDYASLQQAIEKTDQDLAKLYLRQENLKNAGVDEESAQWDRLAEQIAQAEEEAGYLAELKERMESEGSAFINPEETAQFQALSSAIENAESKLETNRKLINEEAIAQQRLNVETAQQAVAAAQTTGERKRALEELQSAQNQLAATANQSVTPKPDPDSMTRWEALRAKINEIGGTVKTAFSKMVKGLSTLKNGVKKAAGWFKNLRSHASSAGNGVNGLVRSLTSMKTMLVSRIKRTFITQIVNGVTEGIQALAQFDSSVDKSISNIKNSFRQVGANIAVSLGSLISTISPIITAMLDAVSAALNKLNALIAMLRGQNTVTIAKKQNDSYAESLNCAAGAAGKAAKAQKKYNATLTNYDELHKLSDNNDADSGAGGNAGADMFETVPVDKILKGVPQSVTDFVQRIKDAITQGDWYGVGAIIAEGLNSVVDVVDNFILRVQPKLVAAAAAFGEGINGFVENFNFENFGTTIGDGVNTIFSTLDSFITTTKWGELGRGLTSGINGFVHRVNWTAVGTTIAHGLNGAIDFIYGAVDEADWDGYGEALGDEVNGFIENTDFAKAGRTFEKSITGILSSITSFISRVKWWELGQKIGDFITNVNWGEVIGKIFELLGAALAGAFQLLGGLASKIITAIKNAIINKAKELGFDIEGENIILGLLHGIGAALVGIAEWIYDHVFKPIWNGIKKAFGISSPAKEMEPLGDNIAGGLLEGILAGAKAVFDWILALPGKIFDLLVGALDTVKNAGKKLVGGIKDGVSNAWGGFKSLMSSLWSGIGNFLGGVASGVGNAARGLVGGIKDGVSGAWDGFKSLIGSLWSGVGNFLGGKLGGLKEAGEALVGKIKEGITGAWDGLKSKVSGLWDSLKDSITGKKGSTVVENAVVSAINSAKGGVAAAASNVGVEVANGLAAGIKSGKDNIANAAGAVSMWTVDAVKRRLGIASPSKVFMEIGEYIDAGLVQGINKGRKSAVAATLDVANSVTDTMQDSLNTGTVRFGSLTSGLDLIIEKLEAIADRFLGLETAMPELALGTVIPPRTRISDFTMSSAETESAGLNRKLDQLIALLTAQQNKESNINITVPVKLDQRQLGDAVARYTLSGQRKTNGGLR